MELTEQRRYKELDALRGLACLMVVFFHFTYENKEYNEFFRLGNTGVDLFFMISGFVIFMSLQKISSSSEFIINRVSRLYPTYWTCVSFTFILSIIFSLYKGSFQINEVKDNFITFIGNLTMFQFYLRLPDLDAPYWTMIIEMIFYTSILLIFQLRLLKYINLIGIISCSILVVLSSYFIDIRLVKMAFKEIPFFQFLPLFFGGTVFYRIYIERKSLYLNYLIIAFCFLCQVLIFPMSEGSKVDISLREYIFMLTLFFTFFILFVNHKLNFITNEITLFLGKISFALYLIHQYISCAIIIPIFHKDLGINFWIVTIFIDLPIIIGIASLITFKIEFPFSRKMKNKLRATFSEFKIARNT